MRKWLWAGILGCLIASAGHAQVTRHLPANGKLGDLVGQRHPFPMVQLDNKVVRLAASARIFDRENRTILHNQLPQYARVLFVADNGGQILRIYLLRPDELARLEAAARKR